MEAIPSVLICGMIRDPDAFGRDLDTYLEWRSAGRIDRIVFSGWSDNRDHDLVRRMAAEKVRIVLSHQPVIRGPGYIFHQMKALHFGLQQFEPDDLVLRSRTDKTWLNFSVENAVSRFWMAEPPTLRAPFSRRPIIQSLMPLQPFFFNDIMFMGLARDLQKLVTFDLWYELEHFVINPEQIFHLHPHRATAQATRFFLRVNPGVECHDGPRSQAISELLLGSELYLHALAESYRAIEEGYLLGWEEMGAWHGPDISLAELIYMPVEEGRQGLWMSNLGNNLAANHPAVIPYMLDRPISPTDKRTLRQLGGRTLPDGRVLGEQATLLERKFARAFPDHPNPPRFPYDDGPLHIIPPRIQNVVAS